MPPTGWVPATKADSKAPAKKAGAIKKKTPARKPGPRKLAPARNLCVAAESFDDGAVKKKTTARKPGPRKLAPVRNLCVAEESFDDVFPDDDWGIEIVTYRGKGQAIPSTPFNLQFESDDEDDDYSGRGSEFRRALEHRSDYRFMWGKQVSETVHDLVVGKPGASVVLKAGVRSDEQDIIVVGRKGSVISTQDFSKACSKMQKIKPTDDDGTELEDGDTTRTFCWANVSVLPRPRYFTFYRTPGVKCMIVIDYDS